MHAVTVCLFAGAGLMLGLVHFLGLRVNTRLFLEDGASLRAVGLHLMRVVATIASSATCRRAGRVASRRRTRQAKPARTSMMPHVVTTSSPIGTGPA